jgi:hypothetical protein
VGPSRSTKSTSSAASRPKATSCPRRRSSM